MGLIEIATLRLRYVQAFRDRHGVQRHYFRRPGCDRVRLPGLPGSAAFMAAYQAALDGTAQPPTVRRMQPGTFDALVAAYYADASYLQLSPTTRATYRNVIEPMRAAHGIRAISLMQQEHVRRLVSEKAAHPNAANSRLKALRILLGFAVKLGWRADNPADMVEKLRVPGHGFATWTEDDITAFETRWPLGTRERLAFALMLYTGQRGRSDVARMGQQHLQAGRIAVTQQKTGARLLIPVHPELRAAIDACQSGHLTFVTSAAGAPFTSGGFGNWFADAVRAAGLAGKAGHGLRKAAARRMAEAGCTVHEIASITGHRSLREVETYTRAADQIRSADRAIGKVVVKPRGQV